MVDRLKQPSCDRRDYALGSSPAGQGCSRSGSANRPAQQDPTHRLLPGRGQGSPRETLGPRPGPGSGSKGGRQDPRTESPRVPYGRQWEGAGRTGALPSRVIQGADLDGQDLGVRGVYAIVARLACHLDGPALRRARERPAAALPTSPHISSERGGSAVPRPVSSLRSCREPCRRWY
jgi:hypothetical protein